MIHFLETFNQILNAGIAITAFSLLIYALSFNLRDRVARTFAGILLCVVTVFSAEAISSAATDPTNTEMWLRLQWIGITLLPAIYLHFSDALLATTGRPSRGRRHRAIVLAYLAAIIFLIFLPVRILVGPLAPIKSPAPHLEQTSITFIFTLYYVGIMLFSWVNFLRAYRRTVTSTSRRRMGYLITGALAPTFGVFPYLLYGSAFGAAHPLIFWVLVTLFNILVSILLVLMAYAVAFFGVPWPDRVVKRRLFKWLMRGPVTASTVLAITTIIRRGEISIGIQDSGLVPVIMVIIILLMEHLLSLVSPTIEKWLFHGGAHSEITIIETLEDRILSRWDLRQFLESVLAAICDLMRSHSAFIATVNTEGFELIVTVGQETAFETQELPKDLMKEITRQGDGDGFFLWRDYWLKPLHTESTGTKEMIGLLCVFRSSDLRTPDPDQLDLLNLLCNRAAMALEESKRQQEIFRSFEILYPKVDMIQRLRAAARYDGKDVLTTQQPPLEPIHLKKWVKDALSHYWGGPKLSRSPLLRLTIVQKALDTKESNPTNALRSVLKQAIEKVKPEGDRRFTAEWILYNILEMKFVEGRKVRDIALRLAMSEADLYRKQHVAIEAVARTISEMESEVTEED